MMITETLEKLRLQSFSRMAVVSWSNIVHQLACALILRVYYGKQNATQLVPSWNT